eukprot:jgi/Ulvmu1/6593/UM003_0230.1
MESDGRQQVHDVVIIGGGVAGLSAAQELLRNGCENICVLEAQNRLGGRVKQVSGIAPWALDAGAELVHGQDSTVASLLTDSLKVDLSKKEYPNYVYWPGTGEIECACGDEDEHDEVEDKGNVVRQTFNLIEQLAEARVDDVPEDTTAEEWFRGRRGDTAARMVLPLLDAFYANDLCSDLRSLGAVEAAWEARQWRDGEDTLVKAGTMAPLTAALGRAVPVRIGTPVREVRWRQQAAPRGSTDSAQHAAAEIVGVNGEVLRARTVICAAPLTQLQNAALRFSPAPPAPFQRVLRATRVHNAVKIWAVFRVPFWEAAPRLRRASAAAAAAAAGGSSGEDSVDTLRVEAVPSTARKRTNPPASAAGEAGCGGVAPFASPAGPRLKPARSLGGSSLGRGSTWSLKADCMSDDTFLSDGEARSDTEQTSDVPPGEGTSCGSARGDPGSEAAPEFWNMLCPECPIPEFWVPWHAPDGLDDATGATVVGAAQGASGAVVAAPVLPESVHVLQGFACAAKADELSSLSTEAAVQVFLDQLDRIFGESVDTGCSTDGGQGGGSKGGPASAAFLRGGLMDWSKEPFVQGGYSSPSPGVAAGERAHLHALPGGTVFFAGEHTHERLNACLQGAMETGVRAAACALHSLGGKSGAVSAAPEE